MGNAGRPGEPGLVKKKKPARKAAVRKKAAKKKVAKKKPVARKIDPKTKSLVGLIDVLSYSMLKNGIQVLKIADPNIELVLAETTIYNYNQKQRNNNATPNADSEENEVPIDLDSEIDTEKILAKLQQEELNDEQLLYHSA